MCIPSLLFSMETSSNWFHSLIDLLQNSSLFWETNLRGMFSRHSFLQQPFCTSPTTLDASVFCVTIDSRPVPEETRAGAVNKSNCFRIERICNSYEMTYSQFTCVATRRIYTNFYS